MLTLQFCGINRQILLRSQEVFFESIYLEVFSIKIKIALEKLKQGNETFCAKL